jgi:hypothetical protein
MSNNENPIPKQVQDDEISINFGEIWRALLKYKFLIIVVLKQIFKIFYHYRFIV